MHRTALALLLVGVHPLAACESVDEDPTPAETDDDDTPTDLDEATLSTRPSTPCDDPVTDDRGRFTDVTDAAGVTYATASLPLEQLADSDDSIGISLLGGFTVADLDGDGHLDLLFTDKDAPPRFFRGDGDFGFTAVDSAAAGVPHGDALIGASAVDLDGDRLLDVYLLGEANHMLRSRGDGTFEDLTAATGLAGGDLLSVAGSWADYDRDGDLDVFVANHGPGLPTGGDDTVAPDRDQFFVQQADGTFVDRVDGLFPPEDDGFGFIGGWLDADSDGWQDLYVANAAGGDFVGNQYLRNRTGAEGTPTLALDKDAGLDVKLLSMGLAVGDYDNDRDLDLHVTDAGRSFLARNEGDGTYVDVSLELADFYGPATGEMAWGTDFFDYDNDGNLELFTMFGAQPNKIGGGPNDIENRLDQRDQLFVRKEEGDWHDIAPEVGLDDERIGRTEVPADIDRDGTLDLVTWRLIEGPRVYKSQCHDRGWLLVALDLPGTLNRYAIGSRVEAWAGDEFLAMREVSAGSTGLFGSGPPEVHIGLGDHAEVDLVVRWPDGTATRNDGVATKQAILLTR